VRLVPLITRKRKVEMKLIIFLGVFLASLSLIFIIQNITVIDIRLFIWTLSISLPLLMFGLILAGLILGWLMHSYSIHIGKNV
jgi:uncharacterized integral membrane protein